MLVIKNGRVIDPVNNVDEVMDVVVDGDEIVKTGKNLGVDELGSDVRVIDATGFVVSPGLVDSHVHFRDPGFTYKEDIYSGAKAAAKGGVTTVILMANTKPPVDNPETLKYVLDKGAETDINILTTVNVTKGMRGKEIVDMEDLASKGAAGFTDDEIKDLMSVNGVHITGVLGDQPAALLGQRVRFRHLPRLQCLYERRLQLSQKRPGIDIHPATCVEDHRRHAEQRHDERERYHPGESDQQVPVPLQNQSR